MDAALSVLDAGRHGRPIDEAGRPGAWDRRGIAVLARPQQRGTFPAGFDRVTREVVLPEPDPAHWKEQLKLLGYEMRKALSTHRDVAPDIVRSSAHRATDGPADRMALHTPPARWDP